MYDCGAILLGETTLLILCACTQRESFFCGKYKRQGLWIFSFQALSHVAALCCHLQFSQRRNCYHPAHVSLNSSPPTTTVRPQSNFPKGLYGQLDRRRERERRKNRGGEGGTNMGKRGVGTGGRNSCAIHWPLPMKHWECGMPFPLAFSRTAFLWLIMLP